MAAVLHGSPMMTNDCDLAIYFDEANRQRVTAALAGLNARPFRFQDRNYEFDEKIVGPWTFLTTDAGRVDLIVRLAVADGFDGLYARAVSTEFEGVPIRYASLEDLIDMKSAAGRDKDVAGVEILRSIQQERRGNSD
jgi:hypothetical protein